MFHFVLMFFIVLTTSLCAKQDRQSNSSGSLDALFVEYFGDLQRIYPEFSTFIGETTRHNSKWTDYSEEGILARRLFLEDYLERLLRIDRQALSAEQQINHDLFKRLLEESQEALQFDTHYMCVNHLSGPPIDVENILPMMPKNTKEDFENIIERLESLPLLINQTMRLLEKGLSKGITPPQVAIQSLPKRLENLIAISPKDSIFFQPFTEFPIGFTDEEKVMLGGHAESLIANRIYPAYKMFIDYLNQTYLPACRQTTTASALPKGFDWYRYCIKMHTTTELSPQEIHSIGLAEVERIQGEMQKVISECNCGTMLEFLDYLNTNPEFYYDDVEGILSGYRKLACHIEERLPQFFGKLPKLSFEIVPIPSYSEQGQIGAYYMPGSPSAGRPGKFFVNTFDLKSRPKWQMECLILHESIPGHHFQISLSQESESLPEFRKHADYTAYIEGWALYAESLGSEFGLYQSPYSKFGRLITEMWRAVRLVVDTGMHAMGWTREEAIAYFMQKTGESEREVTIEIDRYLVWPGQALAYKIGELTIQRWKKQAQEALGDKFDIRQFHDAVLEQGALPLDICESQILAWIHSRVQESLQEAAH